MHKEKNKIVETMSCLMSDLGGVGACLKIIQDNPEVDKEKILETAITAFNHACGDKEYLDEILENNKETEDMLFCVTASLIMGTSILQKVQSELLELKDNNGTQ